MTTTIYSYSLESHNISQHTWCQEGHISNWKGSLRHWHFSYNQWCQEGHISNWKGSLRHWHLSYNQWCQEGHISNWKGSLRRWHLSYNQWCQEGHIKTLTPQLQSMSRGTYFKLKRVIKTLTPQLQSMLFIHISRFYWQAKSHAYIAKQASLFLSYY